MDRAARCASFCSQGSGGRASGALYALLRPVLPAGRSGGRDLGAVLGVLVALPVYVAAMADIIGS